MATHSSMPREGGGCQSVVPSGAAGPPLRGRASGGEIPRWALAANSRPLPRVALSRSPRGGARPPHLRRRFHGAGLAWPHPVGAPLRLSVRLSPLAVCCSPGPRPGVSRFPGPPRPPPPAPTAHASRPHTPAVGRPPGPVLHPQVRERPSSPAWGRGGEGRGGGGLRGGGEDGGGGDRAEGEGGAPGRTAEGLRRGRGRGGARPRPAACVPITATRSACTGQAACCLGSGCAGPRAGPCSCGGGPLFCKKREGTGLLPCGSPLFRETQVPQ